MSRPWRLLHHHKPSQLQMARQVLRCNPRGQLVGVMEAPPPVERQGECESTAEVIRVGRVSGATSSGIAGRVDLNGRTKQERPRTAFGQPQHVGQERD
jgi:hypothetical protein